jgi:4-hydroxy 2-oxovalerate aldolase
LNKINLLDTTLRDGSYAVNFSFTSNDTSSICEGLEKSGIKFIEIGHGLGFNARNLGYGQSIQTDEEYMIAAKKVLVNSKFGMFCIPGIARLEDIDLAAKHDIGFIRIGTDVNKIETSKEFVKRAKDYGIQVSANYMKSYALTPEKFAEKVKISERYGADIIYVVDSAGGMFPEDVSKYFKEIRKNSEIQMGFHGHDNLGLAVANSLIAIDSGANIVDCSLQGLGRSSGNACTEILVMALIKKNFELGINYEEILEVGRKFVQPLISTNGKSQLDIIAGYADFHSSYMHHIMEFSTRYHVDPIKLIIEYSKINKVEIDKKELEKVATKLNQEGNIYTAKYRFNRYVGREQDNEFG